MIHSLRFDPSNGIPIDDLVNLEKVSVVCGANNSGKTTLLTKIIHGEHAYLGEVIDEEILSDIKKVLSSHNVINAGGSLYTPIQFLERFLRVDDLLLRTINSFPYIFINDHEQFVRVLFEHALDEIEQVKRSVYLLERDLMRDEKFFKKSQKAAADLLQPYFADRFTQKPKSTETVLVTPKRTISTEAEFSPGATVRENGMGLIQHLFYLKSKLPNTPERKFFEAYWNAFKDVTGYMKFDIEPEREAGRLRLFFSGIGNEDWRDAEACGLGLRDLMVILYFAMESKNRFVMIEEPENHLHPDMQRRLLRFLKHNTADDKQFLISTHSSVFLDNTLVDSIYQTSMSEGRLRIDDATSKAQLLNDLGYSVNDNLISDLIILVEGSSDKAVLIELLTKLGVISKNKVSFWILNGDNMMNIDLEPFAERHKMLALLDKDPKSDRTSFLEQCGKYGVDVTTLERYSIESYFPVAAIAESFSHFGQEKGLVSEEPIWEQLGIDKRSFKKGYRKFARSMTIDTLEGTDLKLFLDKVQKNLA